jgi:hypothetical protein
MHLAGGSTRAERRALISWRERRLTGVATVFAVDLLLYVIVVVGRPVLPPSLVVALFALPALPLVAPAALVRRFPGAGVFVTRARARIDADGDSLIVVAADGGEQAFRWTEITGLTVDRRCRGRLLGRDSRVLATLPPALVRPQRGAWRAPSLAILVVKLRPDRFVAGPSRTRFTQPYTFHLRQPGDDEPDVRGIERRQDALQAAVMAAMIVVVAALALVRR